MTEEVGVNEAALAMMSRVLAKRQHVDAAKAVQTMAMALNRVANDEAIERLIDDVFVLEPDDEQDEVTGRIVAHLREIQENAAAVVMHRCRSGPRCGKDTRRTAMMDKERDYDCPYPLRLGDKIVLWAARGVFSHQGRSVHHAHRLKAGSH